MVHQESESRPTVNEGTKYKGGATGGAGGAFAPPTFNFRTTQNCAGSDILHILQVKYQNYSSSFHRKETRCLFLFFHWAARGVEQIIK